MNVVPEFLALVLLGASGISSPVISNIASAVQTASDTSSPTSDNSPAVSPEFATSSSNVPAVNLTVDERRRICKMFAAVIGKNPKRCNTDPDKYYEELVAEQQRRAEAAEARKKKADEARKAQLEADKHRKAEQLAKAAEAEKKADEARKIREAQMKTDAENAKKILEAQKAAEDARRMAIEASRKADQLKEGQAQKTAFPASSDMLRQRDLQRRGDHANFSVIGIAGMGTYYGFGASGRWNPPFLDERISVKTGLGGVQISNSALSDRRMNSVSRLYWSPSVVFNVLKRDGLSLDVGPSYTWIGKFGPHLNTVRMFGLETGIGYKNFELGLGIGNNSVDNGLTDSGWLFHGQIGWRFLGF